MKKLFKTLFTLVVLLAIIYFAPKLVHKCDDCNKWFVGPGYKANIIANVISDDNQTICKDCAEIQHKIEITLGKSISEYRKEVFNLDEFLSKFE